MNQLIKNQRIRKRFYKTLGSNIINNPLPTPYLGIILRHLVRFAKLKICISKNYTDKIAQLQTKNVKILLQKNCVLLLALFKARLFFHLGFVRMSVLSILMESSFENVKQWILSKMTTSQ